MRKKLCIAIQRYGTEIVGGAEAYCRAYAEKLSKLYELEVITTCALDYQEWSNHYSEGLCDVNGVKVRRFKVDLQRNQKLFADLTQNIYNNSDHSVELAKTWIDAQGPLSKGLIDFIDENRDSFDLFIFMSYLYYHTAVGLPIVKEKAILIPFAQNEPPIYIRTYKEIFTGCKGIIYNTEEEMVFIQNHFKNKDTPSVLTGIGIDVPLKSEYEGKDRAFKLTSPYILYMGTIDSSKGCDTLFEYFKEYKKQYKNDLKLVLTGKEIMKVPKSKDIISLGFVAEEEKYAVLSNCIALVLPSHFECLAIAVLEAFALEKPVLVSGQCDVLKGHCVKSNAGLYFYESIDFLECLDLLYNKPELRAAMGINGKEYVDKNYQWNVIMEKLTKFLNNQCE